MHRSGSRGFCAIAVLAGFAIVIAACRVAPTPTATPSFAPGASSTPPPSQRPSGAPPSTGTAFGDAWITVVEAHDDHATEVMVANPLSEWDLVGTRLIDLVGQTRGQLAGLAPPAELRDEALALDDAMAATLAMLEAIEPHGSRTGQAEAYQRALDDWVEHVRPRAQAIRDALGLPPVPPGDLHL
jgi:hypothetical protein